MVLRRENLSAAEYLRENGRHCAGQYKEQWVLSQLFAVQTNPTGALSQLRLGMCFPLVRKPGVLFDYTNVEIGILNETSPAFSHLGGYAQISPLSFLMFRAEASGLVYWPLPTNRAGYYPRTDYHGGFRNEDLPAGAGTTATGFNLNLYAVLRAKVALSPIWAILLLSILNVSYYDIGDASYYFNMRWDAIMRKQDWIIANEAFLGVETRVTDAFAFRYGLFDSYRHVPNAGYTGHQAGLFVMAWWPKPFPAVWDFTLFVRSGLYFAHEFRTGSFSVLAGLITQYRLGGL